jgi:hypothetical protein
MKQTDAVDIIYSLLPKMKNGSPDEIMHKYAASRNLSAAQLERLGHVFNTASTLAALEKDRNSAPPLVDVPSMVGNYIRDTGKSKRASFLQEIEQQATETPVSKQASEVPNIWGKQYVPLPGITKEATDKTPLQKKAFQTALSLSEQAIEEEVTALSKYAAAIDAVAKSLAREEDVLLKFATLRADIAGLSSEAESELICGKLASSLAGLGISIENNALHSAPPVVLHRDRTGYYPQIQQACNHLKVAIENRALLVETLKIASEMEDLIGDDWATKRAAEQQAERITTLAEVGGIFKEAMTDRKDDQDADIETVLRSIEDEKRKPDGELYRMRDLIGPVTSTARRGFEFGSDTMQDVYGKSLPSYLGALEPTTGYFGKMLESTALANQGRARSMGLNRRQIEQDTIAAATLKRLMMTDEVLASKDPEKVFEAFSSIRSAAPEVTTDPSILRLLLRQALETQGMDIDTASAARRFSDAGAAEKSNRSSKF